MTSMSDRMAKGARRSLTEGERAALSPGLTAALETAGAEPQIVARASVFAWIASLWRGHPPIMVLGRRIFWPGAHADTSAGPDHAMSVLQHELQHVLEFSTGALTVWRYVASPRNWVYGYRLDGRDFAAYGAEQRAQIVQDYWLAERGLLEGAFGAADFEAVIPWAAAPSEKTP
jgi:hypothetical protein